MITFLTVRFVFQVNCHTDVADNLVYLYRARDAGMSVRVNPCLSDFEFPDIWLGYRLKRFFCSMLRQLGLGPNT